jgi:hypothetical protein
LEEVFRSQESGASGTRNVWRSAFEEKQREEPFPTRATSD